MVRAIIERTMEATSPRVYDERIAAIAIAARR
jgi:hypothetical protein